MPEEKKKLGEILLEAGVIDKFQLKSALAEQNKWGGRLGNHLVQMGILSEDLLVKALSKQLKIPNLDLSQMMVTGDVLELVPHEIAEKFHLVPVAVKKIANKRTLIVAMSDPTNLDAVDELQFRTGHIIKPAVAGDTAIELAIRRYYYGEVGPQRVAGQPIEFDPSRAAAPPEVTNVPSAGVPIPPENEFALGGDDAPPPMPAPARVAPAAAPTQPDIPEASLADLGMEVTQADPAAAPAVTEAWAAPAAEAAPAWPPAEATAPEPAQVEPEPEPYDPSGMSPAEPAYAADPNAQAAWAEPAPAEAPLEPTYAEPAPLEPTYAEPVAEAAPLEPTYAEPVAEAAPLEPTYADAAPVAEAAPLEPTYADAEPAAEAAPLEPAYAEPAAEPAYAEAAPAEPAYAEPAPAEAAAWNGGVAEDAPVWPPAEAPYPPEEPTVPADEGYAPAPVAAEAPAEAPANWSAEPSAVEPTAVEEPVWAEAAPEPAPAMEPVAAEEPVWPDPAAETAVGNPAPEPEPEPMMAAETSVIEPSVEPAMEPVEPGPAEAEVDRMEQVGAAGWNAGDAVQTFLGTTDGHPYEPTTPGEPTHAPEEPALAADGGAALAAEETHVSEEPHVNGNGATDSTQPDYVVPADPLGGIPFDTAEGRAIRALCALLLEKGLLTADELASRLRTAVEGMGGGDAGEGHG